MSLESTAPSTTLQVFYTLSAITILAVSSSSTLNTRLVAYGSRADASPATPKEDGGTKGSAKDDAVSRTVLQQLLDTVIGLRVPHKYFYHFYVVSVLSSGFWFYELFTQGAVLRQICEKQIAMHPAPNMSADQIVLTCCLMAMQGIRRLIESVVLVKPSTSKMWFVHWLLGIVFYLAMGVTIWIEGAGEIVSENGFNTRVKVAGPSIKTMLGLPIFVMASGIQHDCHVYLASLPKYTLPAHPIFNLLVCPHYTMECFIYLSLAIVSAPSGTWINMTVFSALIFVSVNLSVTASNTRQAYKQNFRNDSVNQRWTMLPGVW